MPMINISNERLNDNEVFKLCFENWLKKWKRNSRGNFKKLIVERVAHLDVVTLYSFLLNISPILLSNSKQE